MGDAFYRLVFYSSSGAFARSKARAACSSAWEASLIACSGLRLFAGKLCVCGGRLRAIAYRLGK